jgi:hypothetical protein
VLLLVVGVAVVLVSTRHHSSNAASSTPSASQSASGAAPAAPSLSSPVTSARPSSNAPSTAAKPRTTAPSTPPPPPPAQVAQAKILKSYMDASTNVHNGIGPALNNIASCNNVAGAVATLHNAADVRTQLAARIDTADVSALPQGKLMAAYLKQAMTASAAADNAYGGWGRFVQSRHACKAPAPRDANYAAGVQDDGYASSAKNSYAALWNPLAKRVGLPAISPSSL